MTTRTKLLAMAGLLCLLPTVGLAQPAIYESDFGAGLGLSDDSVSNQTFDTYNFSFPFGGQVFTGTDAFSVSSNGFVSIGGDNGNDCCQGVPGDLVGETFGRIAVFWADLSPSSAPDSDVFINAFNDDADPENDRLVITWDTILFDNSAPIEAQVQLYDDGRIVMGYNGFDLAGFDDDTVVGVSPGGGVTDPGSTDLNAVPQFSTGAEPTVYELWAGAPPPIDIDQTNIVFTPNAAGGYIVGDGPLEEVLFSDSFESALVTVGHLAPFAPAANTSVNIDVNGARAVQSLQYGSFTDGYVELPTNIRVQVFPDTMPMSPLAAGGLGEPAVIDQSFDLEDFQNYTVVAVGDGAGANQPLALLALEDDLSAPAAGNVKLRIVHAAPFAPVIADTAVSIRTDGTNEVVNGLANVEFGQNSGFFEVPAGEYDLRVSSPDGVSVFIDLAPITLAAGEIVTVFAAGNISTIDLGAFAVFGDGTAATLDIELPE